MSRTRWIVYAVLLAAWLAMSLPLPPASWLAETILQPNPDLTSFEIGSDITVLALLTLAIHGGVAVSMYLGLRNNMIRRFSVK